jgi:hypothetical protein
MTPTNCTRSLGIVNDGTDEENKEEETGWVDEDVWV